MAQLIHSPIGGGPVNTFEQQLVQHLVAALPVGYAVLPNFALRDEQGRAYEYDVVVLAPHAVYVLEAKAWYGRLTGDDTEWLLNGKPRKCPLWLADQKGKVLKSRVGMTHGLWVEPLLVVPDGIANHLDGNWARSVVTLGHAAHVLQDPRSVRFPSTTPLQHAAIRKALLGKWQARRAAGPRRFGSYEVVETLAQDEQSGEYIARSAVLGGEERYRVRTWHVDPYAAPAAREEQERVIRRPAEAITRIGRHPNLLPILYADLDADTNEFYEVTEWSNFGTLYGYLRHPDRKEQLTLRERLEIAAGVANALTAVHACGLVHRNLSPESIVVGFDRQPRLTDFDRAYIDRTLTVFPQTAHRQRNQAYLAPELMDVGAYDFETGTDMYSFGVLLFELLTNAVPFDQPDEALRRNGVPPAMPSQLRSGIAPGIDDLVCGLLRVDSFNARPSATEAREVLLAALSGSSAAGEGVKLPATVPPPDPGHLEVGTVLDGVLRVDGDLGGGSFSRVYKVFHLDQQRTFAMKLLTRPEDADALLFEYNAVGQYLPRHPHIARLRWMSRLAPPLGTPYILSEYVDGETLEAYCDGRKRMALSQVREIGLKLLDALAALHGDPLGGSPVSSYGTERDAAHVFLHRDIKPANILLELPSGQPKLIDFNISARLDAARGRGGTPRYWAPDRGSPEWRPDADLFSLGVVLYEMVTHCHPFPDSRPEGGAPYPIRALRPELSISDEFAEFLLRAVQPRGGDRFSTARQMWQALRAVPHLHAPAAEPVALPRREEAYPGITLEAWEVGRPDYNPYVTRLLTLYSQARRTNAGTRGLDEIARYTYVRTRLDEQLAPALADGRFRLVIVTGNAGDGKTAFLQRVEQYFETDHDVRVERFASGNGSQWRHDGLAFETNYDGSQDEGDVESDAVLARFFAPFAEGETEADGGGEVRLIAINEGRLLDFLDHPAEGDRFRTLRRQVKAALSGDAPPPWLLVVNLNHRAVAAGGTNSLVERQLQALLRDEVWAPCDGCRLRAECPLLHNAQSMRDVASGAAVRERVRRLFEVVHLRRRLHVTMRDLRSALSWLLLRDHGCDDVALLLDRLGAGHSEADRSDARSVLVHLGYPAAFAADGAAQLATVDDRLVRLLRETDVGLVNDPQLDRRLDADPGAAVPWMAFDGRSGYLRALLRVWSDDGPRTAEDADLRTLLDRRRRAVGMWRRWAYFERQDSGWTGMLPYRSLGLLEGVLNPTDDAQRASRAERLRNSVVEAISISEGLRHRDVRARALALRVSRVKDPSVRSYRLFPRTDFDVMVSGTTVASAYMESAPDAVELRPVAHPGVASLRISLDLLEMLELIRHGYRPSPADLQGLFVNLVIFRNELLNLPFNEVLLAPGDDTLYQLTGRAEPSGFVRLQLVPVESGTLTPPQR
jgi:serine/threonine protein kinase